MTTFSTQTLYPVSVSPADESFPCVSRLTRKHLSWFSLYGGPPPPAGYSGARVIVPFVQSISREEQAKVSATAALPDVKRCISRVLSSDNHIIALWSC